MRILAVTSDSGELVEPAWLPRAERVHRQLRPDLPADYARRLGEVFANGGRMAVVIDGDEVVTVAVWRLIENTHEGRRLYVDDLVSDGEQRSRGGGALLLKWLEDKARQLACGVLALDSGVQRDGAHRFYFREGMHIASYCFKKVLN